MAFNCSREMEVVLHDPLDIVCSTAHLYKINTMVNLVNHLFHASHVENVWVIAPVNGMEDLEVASRLAYINKIIIYGDDRTHYEAKLQRVDGPLKFEFCLTRHLKSKIGSCIVSKLILEKQNPPIKKTLNEIRQRLNEKLNKPNETCTEVTQIDENS